MANVCLKFYLLKDTFQLHTVSATVGISLNYVIISKAWKDNQNKNIKTVSDVELYTCLNPLDN